MAVLPEAREVDVEIAESDVRMDRFHSGGAGGQNVNKVETGVRLTHEPTGIVVTCSDERSQLKNRLKAMRVLRARLYDMQLREAEQERSDRRRSQVGTGDRSEKIRTYNFPENRVTDHRIGLTMHNLQVVMEGEIDGLDRRGGDGGGGEGAGGGVAGGGGMSGAAIRDVWMAATARLQDAGIDDARFEAEVLLRHVSDRSRARFYAYLEDVLTPEQADAFEAAIARRLQREPVAYITGHREFYKLDIHVTPDVLIPRPESELLGGDGADPPARPAGAAGAGGRRGDWVGRDRAGHPAGAARRPAAGHRRPRRRRCAWRGRTRAG